MKSFSKTVAAMSMAALMGSLPANASINDDMKGMFDGMGVIGNVTGPGAFHGQSMNLYTGGSLYMRAPTQSYNLMSFSAPSFRAGCGGIDMFAGSFSHINKDQFVAMMRNIGNNSLGYAFELALSSVSPQLMTTIKGLRDTLQKELNKNVNSCESAHQLVNGALASFIQDKDNKCRTALLADGGASDASAAWATCGSMEDRPAANQEIQDSTNPDVAASKSIDFTGGNLMWNVLTQNVTDLDVTSSKEITMLLMSITGTLVAKVDATTHEVKTTQPFSPSIKSLQDLLGNTPDSGTTKVTLLKCGSTTDGCLSVSYEEVTVTGFRQLLKAKLDALVVAMRDHPNDATYGAQLGNAIGFMNMTTIPVYKMLVLDMASSVSIRDKYLDILALEYVKAYVDKIVKAVEQIKSLYMTKSTQEAQFVKDMTENINHLKAQLPREMSSAYSQALYLNSIAQDLAVFERVVRANQPGLMAKVDFAKGRK